MVEIEADKVGYFEQFLRFFLDLVLRANRSASRHAMMLMKFAQNSVKVMGFQMTSHWTQSLVSRVR